MFFSFSIKLSDHTPLQVQVTKFCCLQPNISWENWFSEKPRLSSQCSKKKKKKNLLFLEFKNLFRNNMVPVSSVWELLMAKIVKHVPSNHFDKHQDEWEISVSKSPWVHLDIQVYGAVTIIHYHTDKKQLNKLE